MSILRGMVTRPIAYNEMLGYMVCRLDCIILCGVSVPITYVSNTVACDNMLSDFDDLIF